MNSPSMYVGMCLADVLIASIRLGRYCLLTDQNPLSLTRESMDEPATIVIGVSHTKTPNGRSGKKLASFKRIDVFISKSI